MARQTEVRTAAPYPLRALLLCCLISCGGCDTLMRTLMATAGDNVTLPCPGLAAGVGTDAGGRAGVGAREGDGAREDAGVDVGMPGHGGYLVTQLTWECPGRRRCPAAADDSGRLAEFAGGVVTILGDRRRLSVDRHSWSLTISPVDADDSGHYSCSVNSQPAERRAVLVVLGVPSPPGRPMVIKHTSRRIDLSWAPSLQTNNSPIQYYIVQTRFGDSGSWPAVSAGHRTQGAQTNASITGLTPFTVYTFRVVAVNGQGYSQPGYASYPVSTLRERPGAPPRLTYARNRSSTSIEVGWEPPANYTLHGEFTGYRLTYRRLEPGRTPGAVTEVAVHDVADKSYFIEHLEPYTQYEITLQVKNPEDLGPPASITATTGEGVPSRPENVSVLASGVRDRTVTLGWLPPRQPNGVLRGYNAYWTSTKEAVKSRRIPDGNLRSFTVTDLEPDRQYSIWLKAITAAGEGDRSLPVQVRTDVSGPGAPIITNITCSSDVSLALQWRRPQVFYGLVAMYFLLYRTGDSLDFVERVVPVQSDLQLYSINLPNLTAGQVYEIRIQGATVSRLSENKLYKGQQSLPRKVRMERGCQEMQLYSTWQHRPPAALAGSQLTVVFVAACLLALLAVVAAVIWRRRQRRYPAKPSDKSTPSSGTVLSGWTAPSHEAVPAHLFSQHVRQLQADAGDACRREWEMLQMSAPLADNPRTNGAATKNGTGTGSDLHAEKYQLTRVPVSSRLYRSGPVPAAYFVDGYQKSRAFIVTDRPTTAAASDCLWRLAWEQGVTGVVLIGNIEKSGRLWPEWGSPQPFGGLQLELREELRLAACAVRKLAVSKLKGKSGKSGGPERLVTLFQYTHWPEYGLPEDPLPLLEFVQRTLRQETQIRSPLLLVSGRSFCGAGLYLGLVTLLTQLKYRAELGVFSYWQHIIGQCPNLLPTVDEYSLLHACLLEKVSAGDTLVTRDGARHYIEQLETAGGDGYPSPPAEKQYKSAIAMDANLYLVTSAAKPSNEAKNRSLSYIPMESSRVRLKTPSADGADYINATWLPGYRLTQEYILTQHPLPNTVLDFWHMVWDHRVTTVTCLSPEDFGTFWPLEEEELTGASFIVRHMSESADCSDTYKSSWIIRSFLMESTEGADDLTVRLVHLPLWPEECSTDAVLEGVLGVTEIQGQRQTPLVVIDRYGGTEGASFCVLSTALRQLRQEACFDIFTYAKLYHQRRPGIWKTMREFLYLYSAVEAWLSVRRAAPQLYRGDSCTSICQDRSSLHVKLSGVDGVVV